MATAVGSPVPDVPHAVSVSLPTWQANVGYEEGHDWVVSKMKTGYPRFFINLIVQELQTEILSRYGNTGEKVMLFPSKKAAARCQAFLYDKQSELPTNSVRLLHLEPTTGQADKSRNASSNLSCVFFPVVEFPIAKQYWQHTGEGPSSRRAEYCLAALRQGYLTPAPAPKIRNGNRSDQFTKGPRRYQRGTSQSNVVHDTITNGQANGDETPAYDQFVEERYGRNLNADYAAKAKRAIRRRIAGCLADNMENESTPSAEAQQPSESCEYLRDVTEDDVYLYPCGMNAIYDAHLLIMETYKRAGKAPLKSICFGFPYIDTLKVLEKWGPGAKFYGNGTDEDLDDLERRLKAGERYAALFTEFPSNPLLRSPNMPRIKQLADEYDFFVVVDETIGNYININVLPYTDIIVSSLTKIFTGECNVMGGSLILNPNMPHAGDLRRTLGQQYEDNYWAEDAVFMERNSRDFVSRIVRVNSNTEIMAKRLLESQFVKNVYYPSLVPSKTHYDACRTPEGGYGGLFSVTFHDPKHAEIFFDSLEIAKGPSLGTNFSLSCPFVLLAHYTELDWVQQFGVDPYLVRISVGLESPETLLRVCDVALGAIGESISGAKS